MDMADAFLKKLPNFVDQLNQGGKVRLITQIALKRICTSGSELRTNPHDQISREKMSSAERFITTRLKREFDETIFKTLGKLIKLIDHLNASDRPSLESLLGKTKELLLFKINQQGDWYGKTKLDDLQDHCRKWGMTL
ncbi:MAG: hypothetical protein WA705_20120 [Candidatus Ozemobacteraceae bacterium]